MNDQLTEYATVSGYHQLVLTALATAIPLFCQTPKNGGQTLILSLGVVGCNDGNSSEFRKVTEEGYVSKMLTLQIYTQRDAPAKSC